MKKTAIAALLLLAACSATAADDAADNASEWRIGASLAYSNYERSDGLVDNDGVGAEFFAQYRFNSWLGAEGAYYVSPEFTGDSDPIAAGGETETSFQGVSLNAIGYLPLPGDRIDFFLKAGYFSFFDVNLKVDGASVDTSSDDGLALGVGFSVGATDNIGLRAEFDWYDVSGADLYTVDIGVEYRF
jgi:opacity protein-like surface antigen